MPSTRPQRPYNVRYYWTHREEEIARVTNRQRATLEFLRDLRRVPCADCRRTFPPYVMDFDHRDPASKLFAIMAGKTLLKNREVLLAEVAKCDVVCANCHAIRTHNQQAEHDWGFRSGGNSPRREYKRDYARAQSELIDKLRDTPCADCRENYPPFVMQFDHRDGSTKTHLLSQMAGRAGTESILAEAAQCDIVCVNCHRQRTYDRRSAQIAGVAQLEERLPSKQDVAGSNPVSRSAFKPRRISDVCIAYAA